MMHVKSVKEPIILWVTSKDLGLSIRDVTFASCMVFEDGETAILIFMDRIMADLWKTKGLRNRFIKALVYTLSFSLIHELSHIYSGVFSDRKIEGLITILLKEGTK
jgi:hypothetical protein